MKKLMFSLTLIIFAIKGFSQLNEDWYTEYHNPNCTHTYLGDLKLDSASNVIINFNDGNCTEYSSTRKYSSNGILLWERHISVDTFPNLGGFGKLLCIDKANNIYSYAEGNVSSLITKFNSNGDSIWSTSIPSTYPQFMQLDDSANIYLVARHDTIGYGKVLCAKYDSSGVLKWSNLYYPNFQGISSALLDQSSNLIFAYCNNTTGQDSSALVKLNKNGVLQWSIPFADHIEKSKIVSDGSSNLYFAQTDLVYSNLLKVDSNGILKWTYTNPSIYFSDLVIDSLDNIYTFSGGWNNPVRVLKIDTTGQLIWQYVYSSNATWSGMAAKQLCLGKNKNIFLTVNESLVNNPGSINFDHVTVIEIDTSGNDLSRYSKSMLMSYGATNKYLSVDINDNVYLGGNIPVPGDNFIYATKLCHHCGPNISGKLYFDGNSNCVLDSNETILKNKLIELTPGPIYTNTDTSGNFYFKRPNGNYTINYNTQPGWGLTCPVAPFQITINNDSSFNNDFGTRVTSAANDILINVAQGPARPGFNLQSIINYQNVGTGTMFGLIRYFKDTIFTLNNSSLPPDSIVADTLYWSFNNLLIGESRNINLMFHVDSTIPIGTPYLNFVSIQSSIYEVDMWNNSDTISGFVVGSFDPNDKAVTPVGMGPNGYITVDDSTLLYKIRFQNTGNYEAYTIVVTDSLDTDLDMNSLQIGTVSHNYRLDVSGNGVIKFIFENIQLPPKTQSPALSQGFINFYIKQKKNLAPGKKIRNKAFITFDYNEPVITNSVLNTIYNPTAIGEQNELIVVELVPNPFSNSTHLNFENSKGEKFILKVLDVTGRLIFETSSNSNSILINRNKMEAGTYLYQLFNSVNGRNFNGKMMVH